MLIFIFQRKAGTPIYHRDGENCDVGVHDCDQALVTVSQAQSGVPLRHQGRKHNVLHLHHQNCHSDIGARSIRQLLCE